MIASSASSSAGPAPVAADALARLAAGAPVEARVVAALKQELTLLLIDGTPVALPAPAGAALAPGDRVALQQQSLAPDAPYRMARLAEGQSPRSAFAEASAPSGPRQSADARPQSASGGPFPALGVRTPSSGSSISTGAGAVASAAQSMPAPGTSLEATNLAQAKAILSPAMRDALPNQRPLADFFAALPAALGALRQTSAPRALIAALEKIAAGAVDPAALDEASLKSAIEASGVFREAALARGPATPAPRDDLKAALLVLRGLLAPPRQNSAPSSNMPVASAPSALPAARAANNESLLQAERVADPVLGAGVNLLPRAQIPSLSGDMRSALLALAAALASADGAAPETSGNVGSERAASGSDRPPLRGELAPLRIADLNEMASPNAAVSSDFAKLLRDVDSALDRVRLLQFASLPENDLRPLANPDSPPTARQWQVEIPLALPQGAASLPLMIERDGARRDADEDSSGAVWRMRFSAETRELGPVDVAVTLRGGRIDVRFWAERPETLDLLQSESPKLAQTLVTAGAPADSIRCAGGRRAAPRAPAAQAGRFMDVSS